MNYQELKDALQNYRKARGWDNQEPSDLAKSVVIEAAELLEHFQWSDTAKKQDYKKMPSQEKIDAIQDEIGDVGVYLFALCNQLELDLINAITQKLRKVEAKYPASKIANDKDRSFYKTQKMKFRSERSK